MTDPGNKGDNGEAVLVVSEKASGGHDGASIESSEKTKKEHDDDDDDDAAAVVLNGDGDADKTSEKLVENGGTTKKGEDDERRHLLLSSKKDLEEALEQDDDDDDDDAEGESAELIVGGAGGCGDDGPPFSADTAAGGNDDFLGTVAAAAEGVDDVILAAADEVGILTSSLSGVGGSAATGASAQQAATSAGAGYYQEETEMKSVTMERKEELLMKARKSRNEWIGQVPTPYRAGSWSVTRQSGGTATTNRGTLSGGPDNNESRWWHEEKKLSTIRSTHAARRLPSALPVLSTLYGLDCGDAMPGQVAERIQSVLGLDGGDGVKVAAEEKAVMPTAQEVLQSELDSMKGASGGDDDADASSYLKDFQIFWTQLQDPACSKLVQGMMNFCGKLRDVDEKAELIAKLRSYVQGSFQSVQTHAMWKNQKDWGSRGAGSSEEHRREVLRRCLESFLYGQCYTQIEKVLWTRDAQQKERDWMKRLNDLQFVTPQHLEISCLTKSVDGDDDGFDLEELLKGPMDALRSVGLYYSAYDKLQRIMALYKAVNAALSEALNRGQKEETEDGRKTKPKKLPSADDVLPTIILTVLLAKPERLHLDLEIVEDFSPPEYLRGEAGYAFTNLYGAVHFLLDLDLDEPKSLSIGAEEFKKGLEASRAKTENRIRRASALTTSPSSDAEQCAAADIIEVASVNIPPIEIRMARRRGEDVDLDWAMRWTEQNTQLSIKGDESLSHEERTELHASAAAMTKAAADQGASSGGRNDDYMVALPQGFNRSYSFLTTRPEEVRLSDLPKLLSEYRMLVHTTEVLLAERAEKDRAERRARSVVAEHDLFARVRKVDPSLLVTKKK